MFQVYDTFIDFYDLLLEKEVNENQNKSTIKNNKNHYKNSCRHTTIDLLTPINRVHQYHVQ